MDEFRAGSGGAGPDYGAGEPGQDFVQYAPGVYDYCLSLLGDPAAAGDATQEALRRAEEADHAGQLPAGVWARLWLFAVARDEALGRWSAAPGQGLDSTVELSVGPLAHRGEGPAALAAARLTAEDRELLDLSLRHGLNEQEIAEILGINWHDAPARLDAARARLDEAYETVAWHGSPRGADAVVQYAALPLATLPAWIESTLPGADSHPSPAGYAANQPGLFGAPAGDAFASDPGTVYSAAPAEPYGADPAGSGWETPTQQGWDAPPGSFSPGAAQGPPGQAWDAPPEQYGADQPYAPYGADAAPGWDAPPEPYGADPYGVDPGYGPAGQAWDPTPEPYGADPAYGASGSYDPGPGASAPGWDAPPQAFGADPGYGLAGPGWNGAPAVPIGTEPGQPYSGEPGQPYGPEQGQLYAAEQGQPYGPPDQGQPYGPPDQGQSYAAAGAAAPPVPQPPAPGPRTDQRRRQGTLIAAAAATLVLLLGVGFVLVRAVGGDTDRNVVLPGQTTSADPTSDPGASESPSSLSSGLASASASPAPSPTPSAAASTPGTPLRTGPPAPPAGGGTGVAPYVFLSVRTATTGCTATWQAAALVTVSRNTARRVVVTYSWSGGPVRQQTAGSVGGGRFQATIGGLPHNVPVRFRAQVVTVDGKTGQSPVVTLTRRSC